MPKAKTPVISSNSGGRHNANSMSDWPSSPCRLSVRIALPLSGNSRAISGDPSVSLMASRPATTSCWHGIEGVSTAISQIGGINRQVNKPESNRLEPGGTKYRRYVLSRGKTGLRLGPKSVVLDSDCQRRHYRRGRTHEFSNASACEVSDPDIAGTVDGDGIG